MTLDRSDNLFEHAGQERLQERQPLAARMRPRTLDEFYGQDAILAPGRLLRRAIQADRIASLIFYGPPGTGKTTLAGVIANTTQSAFETLNAVLAGVKDVREVTERARRRHAEHDRRTILFVDEVHRWNKAQQDALLPWVENGTVVLIGATTENPYFTVNRALVSRSRIFQLKALDAAQLKRIARAALADPERGYGGWRVDVDEEALDHFANVANGDARAVLNAIELAVETTEPAPDGTVRVDLGVAEESIQRRAVLYDKEGDCHFDTISAFIKSLRGSDPDAALYWLAKMVYAGEDPRFIFRRMLIFCGEDVGLADPHALTTVSAAAAAFDRVGMPEGRYHLGLATLYLATAPKSNSVMAFFDALAAVENEREGDVPNHLRDASRDKEGFGHGQGYLYPHAYRDHWVAQQYLPGHLQGKLFYQPGTLGYEAQIGETVQKRREEQIAAAFDEEGAGAPPEILSTSPEDRATDRWLERTLSGRADHLAEIRDALFETAAPARSDRVLVLCDDAGLLVWEAVRATPEGGVHAHTCSPEATARLRAQAKTLPALRTPQWCSGAVDQVGGLAGEGGGASDGLRFEVAIGRNVLLHASDRPGVLAKFATLCAPGARLVLCDVLPGRTQRLYALLPEGVLEPRLWGRLRDAEESLYNDPGDARFGWNEDDLRAWLGEAGFERVSLRTIEQSRQMLLSPPLLDRWFANSATGARGSYVDLLRKHLVENDVATVESAFRVRLTNRRVGWRSASVLAAAVPGKGR